MVIPAEGAEYAVVSADRVNSRKRLPASGPGHAGRDVGRGDPEAAARHVLPGLAAHSAPPDGARFGVGGRGVLLPRGLDPAGGAAGRDVGDQPAVKVAGPGDGQEPREQIVALAIR